MAFKKYLPNEGKRRKTKEVFEDKKHSKGRARKNALIGGVRASPKMDVNLYGVQSVTQVLMGERESHKFL